MCLQGHLHSPPNKETTYINGTAAVKSSQRGQLKHLFISYLVLLWINPSPQEGCFPAIHIVLRITGQFYLTKIFINVPVRIHGRQSDEFLSLLQCKQFKQLHLKRNKLINEHSPDLCSVLKMAKMCFVDIKPFSTSLIFRLSRGNMYFFSFS